MKSSVFRSAPARALILSLFASSLTGYVAMVSCTRTVAPPAPAQKDPAPAPPTQQAAPPAPNAPPGKLDVGLPNNVESGNRFYGPATKSVMITPPPPPPSKTPEPGPRLYGPTTKSGFPIRPRREAVPAQQAPQQVQQAPVRQAP